MYRPPAGRYVVDLLHRDSTFQARIRVQLANPGRSVFFVVTRRSTLEQDTSALLARLFIPFYTFKKGSTVAAKKANWQQRR